MTEHKTFPGKVYTVSCAEDTTVVLPDPLGVKEAVVLECTAGQQLHVTATAGRLETSSDQAIVTEVFKLAPRRKLALLQGVAGGWLPKGYVELEYIETSGTQYLDTGLRGCDLSSLVEFDGASRVNGRRAFQGQGFAFMSVRESDLTHYAQMPVALNWRRIGYLQGVPYGRDYAVRISGGEIEVNGVVYTAADFRPSDTSESDNDAAGNALTLFSYPVPTQQTGSRWNGTCRRFHAKLLSGAVDFVPVLRVEDNVAGMWDKVSKQFFSPPAGAGTFGYRIKATGEEVKPNASTYSLRGTRDPYYVAPSGVWARPAGVNGLEVVADTEEVSGAGWLHFDDSAAAEEHFCITQEEILTE